MKRPTSKTYKPSQNLIYTCVKTGEYQYGMDLFEKINTPTLEELRWTGTCCFALNQYTKAESLLRRALQLGLEAARIELATTLRFQGQTTEGQAILDQIDVHTLTSDDKIRYHRERAMIALETNDFEIAISEGQSAWILVQLSDEKDWLGAAIAQLLAHSYAEIGRHIDAKWAVEELLRFTMSPHREASARLTYAGILSKLGHFDEARANLENTICPDESMVIKFHRKQVTGEFLWLQRKYQQAAIEFEHAATIAHDLKKDWFVSTFLQATEAWCSAGNVNRVLGNPSHWEEFCKMADLKEVLRIVQKLPPSVLKQIRMAEISMLQDEHALALRSLPAQPPREFSALTKAIRIEIQQLQMRHSHNIQFSQKAGSAVWIEGNVRLGACRVIELIRTGQDFTDCAKTVLEMAQTINLRSVSEKLERLLSKNPKRKSLAHGYYAEFLQNSKHEIDQIHVQCAEIMAAKDFIGTSKSFDAPWLRAVRDWSNGNSRDIIEGVTPTTELKTDNRQWLLWNLARAWAFMTEGHFEKAAGDLIHLSGLFGSEFDLKAFWSLNMLELLIRDRKILAIHTGDTIGEATHNLRALTGTSGRRWASKQYPNALYFLAQHNKSCNWVQNDLILVNHHEISVDGEIIRNKPGLVRWLNTLIPAPTSANNRVTRARLRTLLDKHQKIGVARTTWLLGFFDETRE